MTEKRNVDHKAFRKRGERNSRPREDGVQWGRVSSTAPARDSTSKTQSGGAASATSGNNSDARAGCIGARI